MSNYGIDISNCNGDLDSNSIIQNQSFVIIRVGYGVSYLPDTQKDGRFEQNYNSFNNRVLLGAYYYQYANEIGEGIKEANNCLAYLGGKHLDLPIYYDIEDRSISGLDRDTLTQIALEFCQTITSAGYKAGIYASKSFIQDKLNMDQLNQYSVWVAAYGTNDGTEQDNAKYDGNQNMWQYSSRGTVVGLNGPCDMDVLYDGVEPIINTQPIDSTPTPAPIFKGKAVIRDIQQWLINTYGYDLNADGFYGPITKKFLTQALQHELNVQILDPRKETLLNEDGDFGPKTLSACINVKQNAQGNITRIIQGMLYCKGYDPNGFDGVFGGGTAKAVRRFQANCGFSEDDRDGIVGPMTFPYLFK